jgi:hypothetical protein
MILKEAEQVLDLHRFDNLDEALEQRIFPIKTFLLTAPILKKTFLTKLEKLALIEEAYQLISKNPSEIAVLETKIFLPQEGVLTSHMQYESLISEAHLQLSTTNKPVEIIEICKNLLTTHSAYVEMWKDCQFQNSSEVILSKQMDRMRFHEELITLNDKGIQSVEAIRQHESFLSNDFKIEIQRLQKSMQ